MTERIVNQIFNLSVFTNPLFISLSRNELFHRSSTLASVRKKAIGLGYFHYFHKHWGSVCKGLPWAQERLNGRWYCTYPQIQVCCEPGRILIKPINVHDVSIMNPGIYSPRAARVVHGLPGVEFSRVSRISRAFSENPLVLAQSRHWVVGGGEMAWVAILFLLSSQ